MKCGRAHASRTRQPLDQQLLRVIGAEERPQTMQGMLAILERDGVIGGAPDPHNARILRTELTPIGRDLLAQAHALVACVEQVMVSSFGRQEADRLALSLTQCAKDLAIPGSGDRQALQ